MINARAETVVERPAYRAALRYHRCLVPATGFYEWRRGARAPQPYLIRRRDSRPMGLGAVWDHWRPPGSDPRQMTIESCAVLTTPANALIAALHDRMPLVVDPANYELWLDPEVKDPARLQELLRPFPADEMEAIPVSARVNSPANDDPSCVEPVSPDITPEPEQRSLF
jgi:putative SOS response-associated peptidase YedK